MNSSIEIDKTKYFLGYYYGIGKVLSLNITPQPGMYFVNGETNKTVLKEILFFRRFHKEKVSIAKCFK